MRENTYKVIELVGTSNATIEEAVKNALSRAEQSVRNMRWFEIKQIRGEMEDNSVTYWQAVLKVGFDIEEAPKEKIPPKAANKERLAQPSAAKEQKVSGKYRCKVCGYIYDPEKGDPDNGVAPGTAFEDLPDDWKCPECGVNKEQFEAIK